MFDRYGSNDIPATTSPTRTTTCRPGSSREGFTVAADAHANYGRTTQSLAATLNMTYLDDIAARLGPDSNDPALVNEMLQDHEVGRFLQDHGYRYVHIGNWFAPTKTVRIADENPVLTSQTDFGALLDKHDPGSDHQRPAGHQGPAQPPPAPSGGRPVRLQRAGPGAATSRVPSS